MNLLRCLLANRFVKLRTVPHPMPTRNRANNMIYFEFEPPFIVGNMAYNAFPIIVMSNPNTIGHFVDRDR